MTQNNEADELEAVMVDPSTMTVAIGPGELVILPVDCDTDMFVAAAVKIPGLQAWPLPDSRVAVQRDR